LIPQYEQVFSNPWRKRIPCHLTFHLWHTQLSWTTESSMETKVPKNKRCPISLKLLH
jgi:hypothetical protein